ncbi:MAG: polysaccharide biosynthesis tyrosine autokinase [Glaciecola sp.]|nr:polysaccharide biosynthesis tyrosine autokinase [Glaciecola sp.]MDG1815524.1 polysaccharide biosynthesis tyrosine autokinase [Glaciecola sp.]MDG2099762.1 polysaccharide biosynthesis tyrosine autokinase [Glaciecola sp.]
MNEQFSETNTSATIDLRSYWRVITRSKWGILLIMVLSILLGGYVAATATPIYQATSKILADPQQPNAARDEQYISSALVFLFYETQYEIIQSRAIAEEVVDKLDLVARYKQEQAELADEPKSFVSNLKGQIKQLLKSTNEDGDGETTKPTNKELSIMLAQTIQAGLKVSGGKQSQIINISYESDDPQLATDIINAVSQAYIQFGLKSRLDEVKDTETWLSEQSEELRANLSQSENKLKEFRLEQGIVDSELQQRDSNSRMQSLNNQLISAQTRFGEAEEQYRQVNSIAEGSSEFYSLGPVLENRTASDLVKAESNLANKVSELQDRYKDKHPKMIAAKSELKSAQDSLKREISKIVDQIEREYTLAQQQVRNVEKLIADGRSEIQALQGSTFTLTSLEREVENNRRIYETFMAKLMEANVKSEFNASNVQVIDYATVPSFPIKPNILLIIVMSIFMGGFLSLVYAFGRSALNNTYNTTDMLEENLHLNALGITHALSKSEQKEGAVELKYLEDSRSVFAEGINTIRTGLQFSNIDSPPKTILVTSASGSEGKSTLAMNLAASYAHIGKTLLLEVDLRKPSVAKNLKIHDRHGLTDILAGTTKLADSINKPFPKHNIDVLLAGTMPHNPLEVLASDKFEKFLKLMHEHYDHIILDGPPTLPVSDSCILGNKVDGVILAVRAEETKVSASKEAVKRLRNLNVNLIGAVLTVAEPQKMSYYGEHYYGEGYYGNDKINNTKKID